MAVVDSVGTLPTQGKKSIAAVYAVIALCVLAYTQLPPEKASYWPVALAVAVFVFVGLGVWFAYRLPKESLRLALPLNVLAFTAFAIELALVAPQEQTLGNYIRIVYVHAGLVLVSLLLFGATVVVGAAHLAGIKKVTAGWAEAVFSNSVCFWGTSTVIGSVAAYLTWGASWYSMEPRIQLALMILLLALAVTAASQAIDNVTVRVAARTAFPALVFLGLAFTGKMVHPNNAFMKSDSLEIKIFALSIIVVFLGVALQSIRWRALKKDD